MMKNNHVICAVILLAANLYLDAKNCCFNALTAFGDSYTDIGNAGPIPVPYCVTMEEPPYAPDTNPGGKIWVQDVAATLCLPLKPSSQGGTDYAFSDNTSAQVLGQVQAYVNFPNAAASCKNLFVVQPAVADLAVPLFMPVNFFSAPVEPVVNNIVASLKTLQGAGARYTILPNGIDISELPVAIFFEGIFGRSRVPAAELSSSFNAALLAAVNNLCFDVIQVDSYGLQHEVIDDPASFGFTNVTTACCCGAPTFCTTTPGGDCSTFYYWDFANPTGAAHQLFADYVTSVLSGPQCFAQLAETPLGAIFAHNVTIKQQLAPVRADCSLKEPYIFVGGNYSPHLERAATCWPNVGRQRAKSFTVAVGGIYPCSDTSVVGLSYGFTRPTTKDQSCCPEKIMLNTISTFANFYNTNYYVTLLLQASALHADMQRSFNLAAKKTLACGSTHGNQFGLSTDGAYYFLTGCHGKMGVIGDIDYNRIKVKGYTEQGAGVANLRYCDRVRNSIVTGIGLQGIFETDLCGGSFVANMFMLGNKDWKQGGDVRFNVATLPGSHARLPACRPHEVFGSIGLDLNFAHCCGAVLTAGYHARFGKAHLQDQVVSFSLGYGF